MAVLLFEHSMPKTDVKIEKQEFKLYFWGTNDNCVSYYCYIAINMNTQVSGRNKQIHKLQQHPLWTSMAITNNLYSIQQMVRPCRYGPTATE